MSAQPESEDLPATGGDATSSAEGRATRRRSAIVVGVALLAGAGLALAFVALRPGDARSAMNSGHYSIAREFLEQSAKAGDARAQNTLGNLYYLGLGGQTDPRAAASWYLAAALQGNTDAQINVARHYVLGLGVSKDTMRAFAWLFHARRAGREVAEGHIKLLAGSAQVTPTHLQRVRKLYPTVESLRPTEDGD